MVMESRGWRRVLRVCGAAIAIASCAVVQASNSCQSLAGDALLQRVDAHFARCLPSHAKSLDAFTDALITNELDASQRKPLAVVAISSRAHLLDRFAASVATAITGSSPTVEAASAVRVVDLADAAASSLATHTLTQTLRHGMATALSACPQQRTLFLVRNVAQVRGAKLPLLDVFLDPLNGARATLHDTASGRDLDCRHALFVFLYQREPSDNVGTAWRDFLVAQWRQSAETTQLAAEAFTPQALAGRLTTAVVLDEQEAEDTGTRDAVWTLTCELESFVSRLQAAQTLGGVRTLGDPLVPPQYVALVFGSVVLVVGAVLVSAKSFAAKSKQKTVDVAVSKAKKGKKKQQKKKQQHPTPDSSRLASLRSHDHPVTPESEAKSPTSPELTAAVPPEDKTASPVPKTPTPTKKARTGRGKGKTPASAPAVMATRSRRT